MSPPAIDRPGGAMIELRRASAWGSKLFGWSVVLDGHSVAKINDGGRVCLGVEPGVHVLRVDNGRRHRSNSLRFEIAADATLEIGVEPRENRTQRAGPLGRVAPVLTWERHLGGISVLSE